VYHAQDAFDMTVRVHHKTRTKACQAYKDAQQVVNAETKTGLARLVVRLKPLILVKG